MNKMGELIAYCGLTCHSCPIFLATREQKPKKKREKRAEIAGQINALYKEKMKAGDITDCDGCKTETGRLFSGCRKCQIRKCARQKAVESCAYCDGYACESLERFFSTEPDAKKRLDEIKSSKRKKN
jgi:hypothetical protein